jgi:hypothetical protein
MAQQLNIILLNILHLTYRPYFPNNNVKIRIMVGLVLSY